MFESVIAGSLSKPAFNVCLKDAATWGMQALGRAVRGLTCTTSVHMCHGYGIKATLDWKDTLGQVWCHHVATLSMRPWLAPAMSNVF